MRTNRITMAVIIAVFLSAAPVLAQYGDEPFIECTVGGNLIIPTGHIKNDMVPDSLNAKTNVGFDISAGYYFTNKIVAGAFLGMRNMGVEEFELAHRGWALGLFGKYLFFDLSEKSLSPYLKLSGGFVFNKFASKVYDDGAPIYRELSYKPVLTGEAALGIHIKTNEKGAIYFELAYLTDFMDGITGEYEGTDYEWSSNNQYIMIRAGVLFNIGSGE